ncbi:MAG: AbrB family transcriptional regulator [Spirochaetales bacterium]|nr:AbrB family transcriptional regulator [Spirochaetales bacterium]
MRWGLLSLLSLTITLVLLALRLPAALLLGPMIAAVLLASRGIPYQINKRVFLTAQGIVGLMIAGQLPTEALGGVVGNLPVFVLGTLFTIAASALLGKVLSAHALLPGSTAVWGTSPGAASVMTIMSESFGGDIRLVAFMQYLRVVCCALWASVLGRFIGGVGSRGGSILPDLFSSPMTVQIFILIVLIVAVTQYLEKALKIPGGALILPIIAGLVLKASGVSTMEIPLWFLLPSYIFLGWAIGSRFTKEVFHHAAKLFPYILGSILLLIGINSLFGLLIMKWAGVDLLTALLATSPGGADSVAIIAASTEVDVAFVMSMQITRFFLVLMLSPVLARKLSGKISEKKGQEAQ